MSEPIDVARIGEDVPLLEGMRTTRALRRLRTDPVPIALIRKVCEAGTFAPSGGNRQPWFFIAVTDPERRAWVAERYRRTFHAYISPAVEAARAPNYPEDKRRNMRAAIHLANHLHEVPVLLFVAGWTRRGLPQAQALFPAIQNILLACRAVGLGASLTTVHTAFGRETDEWLGLPEGCPTCAMLPIGWPRGTYRRPTRRSVDSCFFVDRFGAKPTAEGNAGSRAGTSTCLIVLVLVIAVVYEQTIMRARGRTRIRLRLRARARARAR